MPSNSLLPKVSRRLTFTKSAFPTHFLCFGTQQTSLHSFGRAGKVQVNVSTRAVSKSHAVVKKRLNNGRDVVAEKLAILKVEVTDSGAGMTPEQLSQMFRKEGTQFNANKLRKYDLKSYRRLVVSLSKGLLTHAFRTTEHGGGSGLGMFIAKGIVESHSGSLKVDSPGLGCGSTFTLSLPLYKLPNEMEILGFPCVEELVEGGTASNSHDESRSPRVAAPRGRLHITNHMPASLHILVVDDSTTNRRLLLRWLHSRGHVCEEAADGVEAVEKVGNSLLVGGKPFDSILMDYEMPRMNGPKATSSIRQMGCDAFVVGISGNVLPEDVAIFRNHGANAVLPKPVPFPDLENLWYEYGVGERAIIHENDEASGEIRDAPVVRFQASVAS